MIVDRRLRILIFILFIIVAKGKRFKSVKTFRELEYANYGFDVSYPVQHFFDKARNTIASDRYFQAIRACYRKFSMQECDSSEKSRLRMNLEQPKNQYNYTSAGFKKMQTPEAAWEPLIQFYMQNKNLVQPEKWPRANTYLNSWSAPTQLIPIQDTGLRGGVSLKKKALWEVIQPLMEEWTGQQLRPVSLYGVRVYQEGAILASRKNATTYLCHILPHFPIYPLFLNGLFDFYLHCICTLLSKQT